MTCLHCSQTNSGICTMSAINEFHSRYSFCSSVHSSVGHMTRGAVKTIDELVSEKGGAEPSTLR